MSAGDELVTPREFATRQGYKPHYGNELSKKGRLVMAPDGKHCLYQASLERFEASRDHSKAGVVARHAAARAAEPVDHPLDVYGEDHSDVPLYDFQGAKAKREHWAAEREHVAFMREAGELIELAVHRAAMADLGAIVRTMLEAWAPMLAPQLAGRDEAGVRTLLAEQVDIFLRDISAAVRRHSKEDGAAA